MAVLEQRCGVAEQRALAVGDAGRERGDERVDLARASAASARNCAQPLELPLLQPPVGERRVLDGVEHAEQQVRERDPIAERRIELRDAQREAAAHRVEPVLVELRSHGLISLACRSAERGAIAAEREQRENSCGRGGSGA